MAASTNKSRSNDRPVVLLINPDFVSGRFNTVAPRIWPALDLGIIAAALERNNLAPALVDLAAAPLSPARLVQRARQAGLLILSSGQYDRWQCPPLDLEPAARVSRFIRRALPELPILGIGPRTLYEPGPFVELIDFAVKGEPEGAMLELGPESTTDLNSVPKIVNSSELVDAERIEYVDLARLPGPKHEMFMGGYLDPVLGTNFTLMETSRGCPHGCHFCFQTMYGRRRRNRLVESIAEELSRIKGMGFRSLIVADQDFAADRDHALSVCEAFGRAGQGLAWSCGTKASEVDAEMASALAKAGCCFVSVGIETGSDRVHERINTRVDLDTIRRAVQIIREHGMHAAGYVRFGHTGETDEERDRSIDFVMSLPLDFASFGPVIPLGPTPLGRELGADLALALRSHGTHRSYIRRAYARFYLRLNQGRARLLMRVAPNAIRLALRVWTRRALVNLGRLA